MKMNLLNPKLMGTLIAQWQGIHVVDKQGSVIKFDTEPFTHVHIINTFENTSGVTLDLGAYFSGSPFSKSAVMDIPMFLDKASRDSNSQRSVSRRIHLHLSGAMAGSATF